MAARGFCVARKTSGPKVPINGPKMREPF